METEEDTRSRRLSRSKIGERLKTLRELGVEHRIVAGDAYAVANGVFIYYPATGFWRGAGAQGYTIDGMLGMIRQVAKLKRPPQEAVVVGDAIASPPKHLPAPPAEEKPVAGRDSAPRTEGDFVDTEPEETSKVASNDPDNQPLDSHTKDADVAESAAGGSPLLKNNWP